MNAYVRRLQGMSRRSRHVTLRSSLLLSAFFVVFCAGTSFGCEVFESGDEEVPVPRALMQLNDAVQSMSDRVVPAVVAVEAYVRRGGRRSDLSAGSGSGFFINRNGLVVTCNHVIENGGRFEVRTADGQRYEAKVIGRDVTGDVALLQVNTSKSFPYLKLGKSRKVAVGQLAFTCGNAFGMLPNSLSMGIVSGMGREIFNTSGVVGGLIQTDATINLGNSGGPLVDIRGHVIGIANAKIAQATGLGFAIPVDAVRRVLPDLVENGEPSRGFLGIELGRVVENEPRGVLINTVNRRTPAEKAGLKEGDLITSIGSQPIHTASDLMETIARHRPGDTVRVNIRRGEKDYFVDVKLAKRDDA